MVADALRMLGEVKGKVLDAMHFDMLKSAYELQDQSVEQLKNNNDALKESNALLKEKAGALQTEVNRLRGEIITLQKQIPTEAAPYKATGLALKILHCYRRRDASSLEDTELLEDLRTGKLELEATIKELEVANVLRPTMSRRASLRDSCDDWGGTTYALTARGETP